MVLMPYQFSLLLHFSVRFSTLPNLNLNFKPSPFLSAPGLPPSALPLAGGLTSYLTEELKP